MILDRYKKMKFGKYNIYYKRIPREYKKINKMIKKNTFIKNIDNGEIKIEITNIYNILQYSLKKLSNVYKFYKYDSIDDILKNNNEDLQEVISYIQEIINKSINEQEEYIKNKFNKLNNLINKIDLENV